MLDHPSTSSANRLKDKSHRTPDLSKDHKPSSTFQNVPSGESYGKDYRRKTNELPKCDPEEKRQSEMKQDERKHGDSGQKQSEKHPTSLENRKRKSDGHSETTHKKERRDSESHKHPDKQGNNERRHSSSSEHKHAGSKDRHASSEHRRASHTEDRANREKGKNQHKSSTPIQNKDEPSYSRQSSSKSYSRQSSSKSQHRSTSPPEACVDLKDGKDSKVESDERAQSKGRLTKEPTVPFTGDTTRLKCREFLKSALVSTGKFIFHFHL